ncbi:MAG: phosphotransferase [Candidatus Micrarchaeota archaeon]
MEAQDILRMAGRFELRETHISWLLLGKDEVFKIKKPLKFSFLDFSTPERRRFFCGEEVRLNRRLSPDVYLGVSDVCSGSGGHAFDNGGEAVDAAVRMKRLDESSKMDSLLARGAVGEAEVREIARIVASFHKNAEVPGGEFNSPKMIGGQIADLGSQRGAIENASGFGEWVDRILSKSALFIKKNDVLLKKRMREGMVRDCHGDLHSGNIFMQDGIKIIDCIEFSSEFRCIDVASDAAFLAMDLDFAGREDLAEAFVDRYVRETGDGELETLLPFYKCYRANVRAKIAAIEWSQNPSNEVRMRMERYVLLAEKYSKTMV